MTLAPGWRWTLSSTAGVRSYQAPSWSFSAPGGDGRDVGKSHRGGVAIGDDLLAVVAGRQQLVVGVDRIGAGGAVEGALGPIGVRRGDRRLHLAHREAQVGELGGVDLHPHRRPLTAADRNQADAGELGDLPGELLVGEALDIGERHTLGGQGQGDHRRVGGVDLGVYGRRRKVGRQQARRRVDRRLHLLFGHVEGQRQVELEGDDRGAAGTGGAHPVELAHLAELHLERRGDRGGHHVRAGSRIGRGHLDGRVVHLRQSRQRQELEGDEARQQQGEHQQRGRHRPFDEGPGRTHRQEIGLPRSII